MADKRTAPRDLQTGKDLRSNTVPAPAAITGNPSPLKNIFRQKRRRRRKLHPEEGTFAEQPPLYYKNTLGTSNKNPEPATATDIRHTRKDHGNCTER
ncbi:MAG: hypothetical protein R6W72_02290 [Desulfurivibrionaceae bacterium]